MYRAEEVKVLHLEVTSRCNAACPMCLRTVAGGEPNPQLPLVEISLDEAKTIFPTAFLAQLKRTYFCGNYGDPASAQDTLEIARYFREQNEKMDLSLFTNGGVRSPAWWKSLAGVVSSIRFGIDGLESTNHLYRRNVDWKRLMASVEAFVSAGGIADWDFIAFEHNEHEIEAARTLARELGFRRFQVKRTGRFFSNTRSTAKDSQEVLDRTGKHLYDLRPPRTPALQNQALAKEEALRERYGNMDSYLDTTRVACKVAKEGSVYVSAEGFVFPCCWTANQMYPWYYEPRTSQIWKHMRAHDVTLESINAKRNGILEIIESPWMQSSFAKSWAQGSVREGKLKVCAKTCGAEFDPFQEQFRGAL